MSRAPFMPFYVADFLADTIELDGREIGAYMLLLMSLWQRKGTLPADPEKLKRIARVNREWTKVWDAIKPYFEEEDGTISNRRLTLELHKVCTKREINSKSGARGGEAKALKTNNTDLANARQTLQRNPSILELEQELELESSTVIDEDDSSFANDLGQERPARLPVTANPPVKSPVLQKPDADPNWPDGYPTTALVEAVNHRNLDLSRSSGLATGGNIITSWGLNGCYWEHDVVPIVRAICERSPKQIGSFKYFNEAVYAARDERLRQGPTAPIPKRVALSDDERQSIDAVAGFREWRGYGAAWPQGYQKPSGPLLEKALASHGDDDDRDRWRREKQIARERSPPKKTALQTHQNQPEMHA